MTERIKTIVMLLLLITVVLVVIAGTQHHDLQLAQYPTDMCGIFAVEDGKLRCLISIPKFNS